MGDAALHGVSAGVIFPLSLPWRHRPLGACLHPLHELPIAFDAVSWWGAKFKMMALRSIPTTS